MAESAETRRRWSGGADVVVAVVATYFVVCVAWLVVSVLKRSVGDYGLLEGWIGPQYFADYSHGFVRRGLPGAVLGLLSDRSPRAVLVAMWVLTFAALAGVVVVAGRLLARLRNGARTHIPLLLAVIVVSPISVSEIVLDPGRYDFIGIIAAAGFVGVGLLRQKWLVLVLAALVAAVAVAGEELLLVFVVPLVLLCVRRVSVQPIPRARVLRIVGVVLAPALVLAALSALMRPSASFVASMLAGAGHPPTEVYNSATVLRLSLSDEIRLAYDWSRGLPNMVLSAVVWLAVYSTAVGAVAVLLPRAVQGYWRAAGYFALVALGLGLVGVDNRRWWTLAFLVQLAYAAMAPPGDQPEQLSTWCARRRIRAEVVVPALALVVALVTYDLPLTTIFVSDVANHDYLVGLDRVWRAPLHWLVGRV